MADTIGETLTEGLNDVLKDIFDSL